MALICIYLMISDIERFSCMPSMEKCLFTFLCPFWDCFSTIELYGEDNGTPLQYSCLENPMDGGAWWAAVHGVAKSRIRLSDFTFTFQFHALEKEMATHSSVLAWRIPGTGEPAGLPSMGSHRVGHDWSDLAAAAAAAAAALCMRCPWTKEENEGIQMQRPLWSGSIWVTEKCHWLQFPIHRLGTFQSLHQSVSVTVGPFILLFYSSKANPAKM